MTTAPTAVPTADDLADLADTPEVPALRLERFRAYLEDGTVLEVTTDHRDLRAYTTLRDRLKLPDLGVNPLDAAYLAAFQTWHAARYRAGLTEMTWAEWNGALVQLDLVSREAVPPTKPGSGAD